MNARKAFIFTLIAIMLAIIAFYYPILETGETTFINASNITSIGLTPNSGDNVSLITEMNAGYWEGNETAGNPFYIDVYFYNVTSFDAIDIASRYFSSSATPSTHVIGVMIWCTTLNDFVKLKNYDNELSWYERTYYVANSHHYIFPNGTVIIRIQHLSNGNANHVMRLDVLRLIQQPTFRHDTNIFNNYTNITTTAGTMDHANLTNLNWASAGHTIDADIDMGGNDIRNITSIGKVTVGGGEALLGFVDSGDPLVVTAANKDANNYSGVYQRWNSIYWFIGVLGNFTSEFTLNGGMDYTYNGTNKLIINETTTRINTTLDMNGKNITNSGNITIPTGKLRLGEASTASFNDISMYANGSTTDRGFDLIGLNSSGNSRMIFRVGLSENVLGNSTNLPFTAFSPSHSTSPGLMRATAFNTPEYRTGVFTTMPIGGQWINNTQGNFTIYTAYQTSTASIASSGTEKMKIDGLGQTTITNLSGAGNAYVCVDANGKLYRGSPTC